MTDLRFGLCLPQFDTSWSRVLEAAQAAEESGFDAVFAVDHFVGIPQEEAPLFEGWTEIAAVAAVTRRVRIGHLVLCVSYRNPALVAKMAATLDAVSGGRTILGIGAGWHAPEYAQYGYDFPPIGTRLRQLDEACTIMRAMWSDGRATFAGRHFQVQNAACSPKPVQARLPIMIGGGGEKVLLRLVARHADVWNNLGIYHAEVGRKREVLAQHCRAVGRDPAEITVSQQCLAAIGRDRAEAARRTAKVFEEVGFLDGAPELALTGTPDEIRERIAKNRALGVTMFTASFGRTVDPEDVRLFGREIIARCG